MQKANFTWGMRQNVEDKTTKEHTQKILTKMETANKSDCIKIQKCKYLPQSSKCLQYIYLTKKQYKIYSKLLQNKKKKVSNLGGTKAINNEEELNLIRD